MGADSSIRQLAQCLEVGLPFDVRKIRVCSASALLGKPGVLEFAKANRGGGTPATCAQAAGGGHLGIVKSLRAQGCGWDANTCRQAAMGGHLKVLKWVRSNRFGWLTGSNVCTKGRAPVLPEAVTAVSGPREGEIWSCFSGSGNETVLGSVWIMERVDGGGPCTGAARGGHLDIVKWGKRNGCRWDKRTCDLAAQGGHLNVLKWAIENGCGWDSNTFVGAAWGANLQVLRWARANGYPWDTRSCSIAARRGHLKVLQRLRGNGGPGDAQTTMKAAERWHQELLIWALDNHGVWDSRIPLIVDSNSYRYISRWARGYDRAIHKRRFSLISKCEPWLGV
ncbi:unnamed protein product [Ectocarpus sp. CCAP 1310/34]|nr:unnamed protein product [Ectocarpus sp. CCAP 1310/34]